MDSQVIMLKTFIMQPVDFVYSVFALVDPNRIEAYHTSLIYMFAGEQPMSTLNCEGFIDKLVKTKPYKINHVRADYPYKHHVDLG